MDRIQTRLDYYQKYEEEVKEICAELNEYLMGEFGYKTPPAYVCHNTIFARRKAVDIYLRYKPPQQAGWGENTLVIASITFDKQRIGSGTSLLRFLVRISDKYGYETIGIEEASTEKIVEFAKKYGFENYRSNHWLVSVENLKRFFGFTGDCLIEEKA